MRYLAELAWAPDAILLNTALRWREEGLDMLAVSAGSVETASEVLLSLDSEGRIAGAFAPDRPRSATPPILPTPCEVVSQTIASITKCVFRSPARSPG
jgi:hypothetical protein